MKTSITLYKCISSKYVENTIKKGTVKLTRLAESNDPLELLPEGSQQKLKPWYARVKDKQPIVLCLMPLISSAPMWAHYADNHKGAAIAFSFNIIGSYKTHYINPTTNEDVELYIHRTEDNKTLLKCLYSDKRTSLPRSDEEVMSWKGHFQKDSEFYISLSYLHLIASKGNQWQNENEYRLLFPEDELSKKNCLIVSIFKDIISGVALGAKAKLASPKLTEAKVKKWARSVGRELKFDTVYPSANSFAFECVSFSDSLDTLKKLELEAKEVSLKEFLDKCEER